MALVECTVDVKSAAMQCVTTQPAQARLGVSLNRIIGGQERYIKLANSGNAYDPGTEIFRTDVTVQNLMQSELGTDGMNAAGINVFFVSEPSITAGTGSVSVYQPDGYGSFTDLNQPYYHYADVLQPYQISGAREWKFSASSTVQTFRFSVYVESKLTDEANLLDAVWIGGTSTDWFLADNWSKKVVPGDSNVVTVLADSAVSMPVLTRDSTIAALNVGPATTLNLDGHALTVSAFVNAPGAITGGSIVMSGSAAKVSGFVPSLNITGATALQGPVRATGPVSVQGSLTATGQTLTIQIP